MLSNELTTDFSRDADIIKPGLGKILLESWPKIIINGLSDQKDGVYNKGKLTNHNLIYCCNLDLSFYTRSLLSLFLPPSKK